MLKALLLATAALPTATQAATFVNMAGTQVLINGQPPTEGQRLGDASFASSTDPAPFDDFIGSDSASNFFASWSHSYAALRDLATDGYIELGLSDVDGHVAGDQVGQFMVAGFDLTAALNRAVNAKTFTNDNAYGVYRVDFLPTMLARIASGSLSASLILKGPASNVIGNPTEFNGARLDFSRITLNTVAATPTPTPTPMPTTPTTPLTPAMPTPTPTPTPAVPEPSGWALMLAGAGIVGFALRRRPERTGRGSIGALDALRG